MFAFFEVALKYGYRLEHVNPTRLAPKSIQMQDFLLYQAPATQHKIHKIFKVNNKELLKLVWVVH